MGRARPPGARDLGLPLGLVVGALLDVAFADPVRRHPVAGFGQLATRLERRMWRPGWLAGTAYAGLLVLAAVGPGCWLERATRRRSALRLPVVAATTWLVLGGSSLAAHALAVRTAIVAGDLPAARRRLPALCGRDPQLLDAAGLVRATVESVAENTSDAVVAPLVWGALGGLPGLLGYRAANTLDAMVGHRTPRHARFGTPAARLDDVLNWLPARLTALLVAACSPLVGGRPAASWRVCRRDACRHPSPNAGWPEAAFAGALGVRLGGPTAYPHGVQDRPWLGAGRAPTAGDIDAAVRLGRAVGAAALALSAAGTLVAVAGPPRWTGQ